MRNFNIGLQQACGGLGASVEEYEIAKERIALWEKIETVKQDNMADEENE